MIYCKLILSFLQVGLFSFGGGYGILPVIQQQVVVENHWLTMQEFTDVITISQMTPGPISLNASTFVGMRMAGVPGAILATFSCVLPTSVLALIVGYYYYKYRSMTLVKGVFEGLRPAVVSLIASSGISILFLSLLGTEAVSIGSFFGLDWRAAVIFAICFFILRKWKLNPMWIMLLSGAAGVLCYFGK
jgi:chromate transporter